jgi:hypothetical protein
VESLARKESQSALVSLCDNYWYPLYAYLRRRGYSADQAQDLNRRPEHFERLKVFLSRALRGALYAALAREMKYLRGSAQDSHSPASHEIS